MENVSQRIVILPSLGEAWEHVEVIVATQQRVEDQFVDALRLRIRTDARIEVRRTALDHHDHRVRIGSVRASSNESKREQEWDGPSHGVSVSRCTAARSTAWSL